MKNILQWARDARRERQNFKQAEVDQNTRLTGVIDRRAGSISIGKDCMIAGHVVSERGESNLEIGNSVFIGAGSVIDCAHSITIEDGVRIAVDVTITDCDNHSLFPELRVGDLALWMHGRRNNWHLCEMAPIRIKQRATLGAKSIVLKGVTIGVGAIVQPGSVVTKDVPDFEVVAGNPARKIGDAPITKAGLFGLSKPTPMVAGANHRNPLFGTLDVSPLPGPLQVNKRNPAYGIRSKD